MASACKKWQISHIHMEWVGDWHFWNCFKKYYLHCQQWQHYRQSQHCQQCLPKISNRCVRLCDIFYLPSRAPGNKSHCHKITRKYIWQECKWALSLEFWNQNPNSGKVLKPPKKASLTPKKSENEGQKKSSPECIWTKTFWRRKNQVQNGQIWPLPHFWSTDAYRGSPPYDLFHIPNTKEI